MEQVKKTEGWELRLASFIESRADSKFQRCVHDCCAFTAGAIHVMTGYDGMARHGLDGSALEVARVLRDAGGVHTMPTVHGFRKLASVSMASRGDIVASFANGCGAESDRQALGVCIGQISVFASIVGCVTIKTSDCVAAWRVE